MNLDSFRLHCRGRILDVPPGRPVVMGILNVTPDSFSDGGLFVDTDRALKRVEEILEEGCRIIDVGGESTRPRGHAYGSGAEAVELAEELRRVIPLVEAISARFPEALISVDTYKAEVGKRALEAGAHILNDITGLRYGDDLAQVAANFDAPLVVMHSVGKPGALPHISEDDRDVVSEVYQSLKTSVQSAELAGVHDIVIDPGFGFGKTPRQNLELLARTGTLLALGRPVLVGISRKSTIGVMLGSPDTPVPISERLFGTLGATAVAVMKGASIVRTHDVRETTDFLRVLTETMALADPRFSSPNPESVV